MLVVGMSDVQKEAHYAQLVQNIFTRDPKIKGNAHN